MYRSTLVAKNLVLHSSTTTSSYNCLSSTTTSSPPAVLMRTLNWGTPAEHKRLGQKAVPNARRTADDIISTRIAPLSIRRECAKSGCAYPAWLDVDLCVLLLDVLLQHCDRQVGRRLVVLVPAPPDTNQHTFTGEHEDPAPAGTQPYCPTNAYDRPHDTYAITWV